MQYDSLDEYGEQLNSQMSEIEKFLQEQKELIEEDLAKTGEENELMEYRYVRRANGEIVVMAKPYFKLTPKELRDTENCMTNEPFDEKDPSVKIYKLKNPEKFGPFNVKVEEEPRKNNMDIKNKKPRNQESDPVDLKPKPKEKSMEEKMEEQGWNPNDVYNEFEAELPEPGPKKIKTKRKKAVWELIDDILHADKPAIEGGMQEYAEEFKEETEEEQAERIRKEEEKKAQKIRDKRIAEANEKIKAKRDQEKKEKEAQKAKLDEEIRLQKEAEEREKYEKILKKKQAEEAEIRRKQEEEQKRLQEIEQENENRKKQEQIQSERQELKNFEDSLKESAKNSILLYERSVCLNKTLTGYSLPEKLVKRQLTEKEIMLMRYQTIVIPVFDTKIVIGKILPYFLLNSAIGLVHLDCERGKYKRFIYNCIGCTYTIMAPPFNKPLFSVPPEILSEKGKKVLILVFDTESSTTSEIISNDLKRVNLQTDFSFNIEELNKITYLLRNYYGNQDIPELDEKSSLLNLVTVLECTVDTRDTFRPTKPGWEILNRELTLKAFSQYNSILPHNENEQENVCLLFKDISINHKLQNSISWTLEKLISKGLTLTGLKFGYINFDDLPQFRENIVEEKLDQRYVYLGMTFRGFDAFTKTCVFIGPSDPQLAKTTDEKSLRAIFGNTREENCVLPIVGISKNAKDLAFWFGGRINNKDCDKLRINDKMYGILRENVHNILLFISPWIERTDYPKIIEICSKMGISISDLTLTDYKSLDILPDQFEKIATKKYFPGYKLSTSVGLVINLSKEGINDCLDSLLVKISRKCPTAATFKYENLFYAKFGEAKNISLDKIPLPLKLDKKCCYITDNFDNAIQLEIPQKDSIKDLDPSFAVIFAPSDNLFAQAHFAKLLGVFSQQKFAFDQFEILGLTSIKKSDILIQRKAIIDFCVKIEQIVKTKDFHMIVIRTRNLNKKLREIYDPVKKTLLFYGKDGKNTIIQQILILYEKPSVMQFIDLFSHLKGKLFDDPFNNFSYLHDSNQIYPIPYQELLYTQNACDYSRTLINTFDFMKESYALCVLKPYKSPSQLFARTIRSLSNVGLTLVDAKMLDFNEENAQLIYTLEFPDDQGENYKRHSEYITSSQCCVMLFKGKDAIYRMRKVIGPNKCPEELKYAYLRYSSYKNEFENGFYFCQHFAEVYELVSRFFENRLKSDGNIINNTQMNMYSDNRNLSVIREISASPLEELGILIFTPTIVENGNYIYIVDHIIKERCTICNIRKAKLKEDELKTIFCYPFKHNIEIMVFLEL